MSEFSHNALQGLVDKGFATRVDEWTIRSVADDTEISLDEEYDSDDNMIKLIVMKDGTVIEELDMNLDDEVFADKFVEAVYGSLDL